MKRKIAKSADDLHTNSNNNKNNQNEQDPEASDTSCRSTIQIIVNANSSKQNMATRQSQFGKVSTRKRRATASKDKDPEWDPSTETNIGRSSKKRSVRELETEDVSQSKKLKTTKSHTIQSKSREKKTPAKADAKKTAAAVKKPRTRQKSASKVVPSQKKSTAERSQSKVNLKARTKNNIPIPTVVIPARKYVPRYKCWCKDAVRERNASFNVDDKDVADEIENLAAETQRLFIGTFGREAYSGQMDEHKESYVTELLGKLPETISLVVGIDDLEKVAQRSSSLYSCLHSDLHSDALVMPIDAWKMVHALFFAFLTSEVLQREDLMSEIGFEGLDSAQAIRKYHMRVEKADSLKARALRNMWRADLREQLEANCQTIQNLADRLVHKFVEGIECFFLQGLDNSEGARVEFTRALTTHMYSVIHLRARMHLSSFQYRFSWIATGKVFDFKDMTTDFVEGDASENSRNDVRVARSPTIEVRRPKGENDTAREACEFNDTDFREWQMVRQASVVCFGGRVSKPPPGR